MAKVRVEYLKKLLECLGAKTSKPLTLKILRDIAADIPEIGDEYLYKKIFNPIQKLEDDVELGLRDDQLNGILRFLGYPDLGNFIASLQHPEDAQLSSLIGTYTSYVRMNKAEGEGFVFCSPVHITKSEDGKILFTLKGPSRVFKGLVKKQSGCLFILLESADGKVFHHVYKIGERTTPLVLQGVFSGVSTAYDPIGGRVVLVRMEEDFASLRNWSLTIGELRSTGNVVDRKLAGYFEHYAHNNVAPNRSVSFDLEDL